MESSGDRETTQVPVVHIVGDLVALGPLRRDFLPTYQRWINDFGTLRTLGAIPPRPTTMEQEEVWYDGHKTANGVHFTIYDRTTWRPIGTAALRGIDHRVGRRAYERAGFREFGRRRQCRWLGGRLWDDVYMDCLATEFSSPVLAHVFVPDASHS
jgi:diamine N-acetyltransferase